MRVVLRWCLGIESGRRSPRPLLSAPTAQPPIPTNIIKHQQTQATPATTARLRWVLPLRVIPPLDSDPTDLLLDHNLRRCATELLV